MHCDKQRYLTIKSSERVYGTTSDFFIKFRREINYKKVQLIQALFPCTYFNITERNNGVYIRNVLYNLPVGNYSLQEIMDKIANDIGVDLRVYYNDILSKLVIDNGPDGPMFNLRFPSTNSLNEILGFPIDYNVTSAIHFSDYPPSVGDLTLYINMEEFNGKHMSTNTYFSNCSFVVPVNTNKNGFIEYNEKTHYKQYIYVNENPVRIDSLKITIRNHFGDVVEGLGDWSLILKFN